MAQVLTRRSARPSPSILVLIVQWCSTLCHWGPSLGIDHLTQVGVLVDDPGKTTPWAAKEYTAIGDRALNIAAVKCVPSLVVGILARAGSDSAGAVGDDVAVVEPSGSRTEDVVNSS